jgi:hypothetical protein
MLHDIFEHLLHRVSFQFPTKVIGLETKDELVVSLKLSALCSGFCPFLVQQKPLLHLNLQSPFDYNVSRASITIPIVQSKPT